MSTLPLSERLKNPKIKRPEELFSWSLKKSGEQHYDDRALSYFYFPEYTLESHNIDLSCGFNPETFHDSSTEFIDSVLKGIIEYERVNGKIDVNVITWRGLITNLIVLSQINGNRQLAKDKQDLIVQKFDGQIFIAQSHASQLARKADFDKMNTKLKRFMYSGFQFEHATTLSKEWGSCDRSEIEERYVTPQPPLLDKPEYCILVKGGIGDITIAYGAETDCVVGCKDPKNKLANYLELKTTRVITDSASAHQFERKLLKTWVQSFLSGVPKVCYGFRDDNFILKSVEIMDVPQIPALVARSAAQTFSQQCWNGHDVMNFYGILMRWLVDRVQEGETYSLTYAPESVYLKLEKQPINIEGRTTGFLLNEFVEWRKQLNSN